MTTAAGHAADRARKAAARASDTPEKEGLLARAGEALTGRGALIGAAVAGAAGLAAAGVAFTRTRRRDTNRRKGKSKSART